MKKKERSKANNRMAHLTEDKRSPTGNILWVGQICCGGSMVHWRKNQPNQKNHFWPFIHNVTGNDRILGMQHNERKQG